MMVTHTFPPAGWSFSSRWLPEPPAIFHQMSESCGTHGVCASAFRCWRQLVSWENPLPNGRQSLSLAKQRLNIGCTSVNKFPSRLVGLLGRILPRLCLWFVTSGSVVLHRNNIWVFTIEDPELGCSWNLAEYL